MGSSDSDSRWITLSFTLHSEAHAHILHFLEQQEGGGRSRTIREALELYIEQQQRPAVLSRTEIEAAFAAVLERFVADGRLALGGPVSEVPKRKPETKTRKRLLELDDALKEWE